MPNVNTAIEWFDPLGRSPEYYNSSFLKYVTRNYKTNYLTNVCPVQSSSSIACGYFCLFVADKRCMNMSYKCVMDMFSIDNLSDNEKMVVNYVNIHM